MTYEKLIDECERSNAQVHELDFVSKGLYADGVIGIGSKLSEREKKCILAEELGHHRLTVGNIIDQTDISNVKQEKLARSWAYKRLIPIQSIISAFEAGCKSKYDIANHMDVTEEFFQEAIDRYRDKYGVSMMFGNYMITFEPLCIFKSFLNNEEGNNNE